MIYVIYHNNCMDGFTSAYVFHKLSAQNDVEYIPCNHGDPFPERNYDKDNDVCFVLDFSFKRDVILANKDRFKHFMILDHHATAQKELEGLDCAVFDMNRSGALITYDYFKEGFVEYWMREFGDILKFTEERVRSELDRTLGAFARRVSDRDLFQFKLPLTSETYFVQSAYPMTFENWDTICNMSEAELNNKGKLIQQYERTYLAKRLKEMFFVTLTDGINEFRVPCLNLTPEYGTNGCKMILNEFPEYNYACYHWYGDGKKVWGIRSRDGYDCSVIAKHYGGGGHKQASGWLEKL